MRLVRQASIPRDDRDRRYAFFESDFLVEKLMGIDILPPIGILVSPHGLILAAYGKFANSSRYRQFLTGRFEERGSISLVHPGELFYLRLVRCRLAGKAWDAGRTTEVAFVRIFWPLNKETAGSPASR